MNTKKPVSTTSKPNPTAKPSQPIITKPVTKPSSTSKPSPTLTNPMKPIQNIHPVPKKNVWTSKKGEEYDGAQDY